MSPTVRFLSVIGKTAAQVVADFAPVPGLGIAVELVIGILELCENISTNRHQARNLGERCYTLLVVVGDVEKGVPNSLMSAFHDIQDALLDVQTRMKAWTLLSRIKALTRQHEIKQDIERSYEIITECFSKFQLVSSVEIVNWQEDFAARAQLDHEEVMEFLADIQNGQKLIEGTLNENLQYTTQMMTMMQKLLLEHPQPGDRMHTGLSSNLYSIQSETRSLLPNLNLQAGEVIKIGQFPVSGTAAMDIYEGLYLQREKVAIKVVRAVHSNERSKRRFMREVTIWNEIWRIDKGQHILPFWGFCQNDGPFPYMVSPWQKNGNALDYVKRNDRIVDYRKMVTNIARGLRVLHSMKPSVVHGDLKAVNIVIDNFGNPLIADFGLSQVVEDITGIPFTQSRGVSDSYRWFAPEVCVGQGALSLYSDIYAYAMTILEILTHQQPYANIKHTTEVVIKTAQGVYPIRPSDPSVVQRGLDDNLWALVNKCWHREPSARPTIHDIIQNLETAWGV